MSSECSILLQPSYLIKLSVFLTHPRLLASVLLVSYLLATSYWHQLTDNSKFHLFFTHKIFDIQFVSFSFGKIFYTSHIWCPFIIGTPQAITAFASIQKDKSTAKPLFCNENTNKNIQQMKTYKKDDASQDYFEIQFEYQ